MFRYICRTAAINGTYFHSLQGSLRKVLNGSTSRGANDLNQAGISLMRPWILLQDSDIYGLTTNFRASMGKVVSA